MTKSKKATAAVATDALNIEQLIPLNQLKKSPRNARKTPHPAADIEALAASIKAHGILQAPVVEPEIEEGKPTGHYLVTIGEGRRQAQLLRAKRKEIAEDAPIRCLIETGHDAFEISLAENAVRSAMHPADQFEAFAQLINEKGMSVEDIAARFGVTPAIVKQRLKLASVSPRLIEAYRKDELTLDKLSAFAISIDHTRQEAVFDGLGPYDDRADILAALNDKHIAATDPRAIFVGKEAYLKAGGIFLADLFDREGEGYFTDRDLLIGLADAKLSEVAEVIKTEGWKWVETHRRFDYSLIESCRRIYPREPELTEEQQQQLRELGAQYEALEIDGDESQASAEDVEAAIEALLGEPSFDPMEVSRAGAIVTIDQDGALSVQRGFVRKADDSGQSKPRKADNDGTAPLPEKLTAELTACHTAFLQNALAMNATVALQAVLHSLSLQAFYYAVESCSCIRLRLVPVHLERFASGISETEPAQESAERHAAWAARLPTEETGLWDALGNLSRDEQLQLLAHCASLSFDAVQSTRQTQIPEIAPISKALGFNMIEHWSPTAANYLGRISKTRILAAVREGVSLEAAENLANLKKEALVSAAAERLAGKGWLPQPLRLAA